MIQQARSQAAVAHLASELTGQYRPELLLQYICDQAVRCLDVVLATLVVIDSQRELNLLALGSDRVMGDASLSLHIAGPSAESARNGGVSIADDIRANPGRWPQTARRMAQLDLVGARGFPLRLLGQSIGSLTMYSRDAWGAQRSNQIGQTLADFAVLVLAQDEIAERRLESMSGVVASLIDQRAYVYQAQGMIAEAADVTIDEAGRYLTAYARRLGASAAQVAQWVVQRSVPVNDFGPGITD